MYQVVVHVLMMYPLLFSPRRFLLIVVWCPVLCCVLVCA